MIRSLEQKLAKLVQEFSYAQVVEGLTNLCTKDEAEEGKVADGDSKVKDPIFAYHIHRAASNNQDMFAREAVVLKKAAKALSRIEEEFMG